jgi:pimeloyl-ACP methyl ester carboxylesterase
MSKDIFLSGWCGYPELFGDFADEFEFVIPFITHSLSDVGELLQEGGRNLFGWSTGAYIILDQRHRPNFENIVLAAPFKKFTKFTPAKVLEKMGLKFAQFPEKVIEDFFSRCKSPMTPSYDSRHFYILMHQLKYLANTDIEEIEWDMGGVTLLHGTDDLIVSVEASRDIEFETSCRLVELDGVGHYIGPEILKQYKI